MVGATGEVGLGHEAPVDVDVTVTGNRDGLDGQAEDSLRILGCADGGSPGVPNSTTSLRRQHRAPIVTWIRSPGSSVGLIESEM
jgi:hypothetical protein